jgi:hypothetical protein
MKDQAEEATDLVEKEVALNERMKADADKTEGGIRRGIQCVGATSVSPHPFGTVSSRQEMTFTFGPLIEFA